MKPTRDPDVVIEEQRKDYVRYRSLSTGRRWEVLGHCVWTDPNHWGPCGEGAAEPPPSAPFTRPDIPVMPEFECSLCVAGSHLTLRDLDT